MPVQRRIIHHALPNCFSSTKDIEVTVFLTKAGMYLEGSHNVRLTVEEAASCGMRGGGVAIVLTLYM